MSEDKPRPPDQANGRRTYRNAAECLPSELLRELQRYAGGETLYIPASANGKRGWGERSGLRAELKARNAEIQSLHRAGARIDDLADRYALSVERIRRICYTRAAREF
ncbi:CD3324 family protein [Saccharibacillus sp. CPCC 101409]|uniref:CD3324 family protein n=1 Tax=Saccharibacillus sp. CPCC 101409 TaxID=3058041 RepID=UPI0026722F68|nr:CD3324 family protein [Saccharibacillus sp. CPCC 101409]MDO3411473.1 CD3324 family protein [Saccharibacillus sp. CPCC 101409]